MKAQKIGFFGAGKMAEGILQAYLKTGRATDVVMAEKFPARASEMRRRYRVEVVDDAAEVARRASLVFLAVKPQDVMVAGFNFGCGSSREHAPWALECNDINIVIAVGFARIFRQNMFNCGMIAAELQEKFFAGIRTLVTMAET